MLLLKSGYGGVIPGDSTDIDICGESTQFPVKLKLVFLAADECDDECNTAEKEHFYFYIIKFKLSC